MSERARKPPVRRRRPGRVEEALNQDLADRHELGKAERAALRAQAHAVDIAEHVLDPDLISSANRVYLDLRSAAGLSTGGLKPVDAFDTLLAELGRAGAGASDPTGPD